MAHGHHASLGGIESVAQRWRRPGARVHRRLPRRGVESIVFVAVGPQCGVYGDSPRYNDLYIAQLTELLTRYGPIHEVWFDGANGEGPNGRRQ